MTTNAPSPDTPSSDQRSVGVLIALGFVIVLSLIQAFMAVFLFPRFSAIFRDMIGDRPLPAATALVLQSRWVLVGLACLCPFVAQRRASPRSLIPVLAVLLLSIALTAIALFLPLVGTIRAIPPPQ